MKEYKVVVNMPWYVKSMLSSSEYAPVLSVENEETVYAPDGSTFGEFQAGKEMKLSITLKGEEEGKKITGVKILKGNRQTGERIPMSSRK